MKKIIAFCGIVLAACCVHAATVQTASKAWVRQVLRENGIHVSASTFVTNANGTVTISSPFTPTNHPDCVGINLTISPAKLKDEVINVRNARSFWNLIVPTAYAAEPSDPTISITIESGSWVDNRGNVHAFDFGDGYTLEILTGEELPEKPGRDHFCDINANCVCTDSLKTYADKMNDAKAEWPMPKASEFVNPALWFDFDDWDPKLVETNPRTGESLHYVKDETGFRFAVEDIITTDAYFDALQNLMNVIFDWYYDIYDRYIEAHTCHEDNPQHDWETKTCASTWKVCKRNHDHKEGSPSHVIKNFDGSRHYCNCGEVNEPHKPVGGEKKINEGKTGWTQTMTCGVSGCGWTGGIEHICEHKYCMPCLAGDGCTLPCPTCNGKHDYAAATKKSCKHCKCRGCGCVSILTANGSYHVQTHEGHGGWTACDEPSHKDEKNERSQNGKHCLCQCGYNTCEYSQGYFDTVTKLWSTGVGTISLHTREEKPVPTYAKIEENGSIDDEEHWVENYTECKYCGDPWGTREEHTFEEEETPVFKWLSNEKCALRKLCEKCAYQRYQDEESAGGHVEDASIPATYANVSPDVCRKWMNCSNCKEQFYEDCEHVRNPDDECRCENKCGYQFQHDDGGEPDACGNVSCRHCHKLFTDEGEKHNGFTPEDNGHVCACQAKHEGHGWSTWEEVSRDPTKVNYLRLCVSDGWGGNGCGAEERKSTPLGEQLEKCSEDHHVALNDACGCECGYYNKTEADTTGAFHHFDEELKDKWGNVKCVCACGMYHKFRAASTYQKNKGEACEAICAYCDAKAESGFNVPDAPDEMHTPRTGGHCGCLGGHLTADGTKVAKFHIRKPGTCQCLGADGRGGRWHFRDPKPGCPNVCAYSNCFGGEHVAAVNQVDDIEPRSTTPDDHTGRSSYCGCNCCVYNTSNTSLWSSHGKLHKSNPYKCGCYCGKSYESQIEGFHKRVNESNCKCECEEKVISHVRDGAMCYCQCRGTHKTYCPDGKCPNVCHGNNHGTETKDGYSYTDESGISLHTPNGSTCGCQCAAFTPAQFDKAAFHHTSGGNCYCDCYAYHKATECPCPGVCGNCHGKGVTGIVTKVAPNGMGTTDKDYAFVPDSRFCGCKCGEFVEDEDGNGHRYASEGTCVCFCRNAEAEEHTPRTRHELEFVETSTETETVECNYCHQEITQYLDTYKCKRCGEIITKKRTAAHGCNKNEEKCNCGCTESKCRCPACVNKRGKCDTCRKSCAPNEGGGSSDEDEGGNETGGNGGIWDI